MLYRAIVIWLVLGLGVLLAACDLEQSLGTPGPTQKATPALATATPTQVEPSPEPVETPPQAQPTTAPTQAQVRLVEVEGSCEAFNQHAQETGVTGTDGESHPEVVGWAEADIKVDYSFTYAPVEPQGQGQVCLRSNKLDIEFQLTTQISRLEWAPPEPLSPECQAEVERWENAVMEHEMQHVRDIESTVREANEQWEAKSYDACGATHEEAEQKLKDTISSDVKSALDSLSAEVDKQAEHFHESEAGSPVLGIDCGVCP